jgi:hypothetical protein
VRYSEKEISTVRELYATKTATEIAKLMGRTYYSVRQKIKRLGLTLSIAERKKRYSDSIKAVIERRGGMEGVNNPNWKGGIAKDNYHYKKIQMDRYPKKVKARALLHRAVKSGEIFRGPCVVCGADNAHGHHEDYTRPLDVMWLCRKHHTELHKKLLET